MRKSSLIILTLCMPLLQGCYVADNPENGRMVFDLILLSRQHLTTAIFLFNAGESHFPSSLSSFYYTFFSLQRVNYFRRTGKKTEDKIPHSNIWSNSNSQLKVRNAFGKDGLLKIRHRWDYYTSQHTETQLKSDTNFLIEETSKATKVLVEDTGESIDKILRDCSGIGRCTYKCKEFCYREMSKQTLSEINTEYLTFIEKNTSSSRSAPAE